MYLEIHPHGGKYWRMKYRFAGREKRLAIGVYPEISLREARERRDAARRMLDAGQDPSEAKRRQRAAQRVAETSSLEHVAREWIGKQAGAWTPKTVGLVLGRLEREVLPWVGARPIAEISAPDLLAVLRRVEARGAIETAHRIHQSLSQVFRYAIAIGRADRDPAADLRGALARSQTTHRAALDDPREIGALLDAISGYEGSAVVRAALQLAPLVFLRPGELRAMRWTEVVLDGDPEIRIPGERMKMRTGHIVPLSRQAHRILVELLPISGAGAYVFPGTRGADRPLSDNTLNACLRRLGYGPDEMTSHGWRSIASTLLNEQGKWSEDAIERQLAHAPRDEVRAAYHRGQHLAERRRMMQAWADYLDSLREAHRLLRGRGGRAPREVGVES